MSRVELMKTKLRSCAAEAPLPGEPAVAWDAEESYCPTLDDDAVNYCEQFAAELEADARAYYSQFNYEDGSNGDDGYGYESDESEDSDSDDDYDDCPSVDELVRTATLDQQQVWRSRRTKHYSLVHCRIVSGRTHQIRAHMRSIGHPIVLDSVYSVEFEEEDHKCIYAPLRALKPVRDT